MLTAEPLLGTRGEVAVASSAAALAALAERAVVDEVRRLETVFTVFDASSSLHDLRRRGSTDVPELRTVLGLALDWHRRTSGAFHPAMQPLIDVWDAAATADQLPGPDQLFAVVAELHRLSPIDLTIEDLPLVGGLNLNGIAKGWIADRALDTAFTTVTSKTAAVTSAWLNLGGDVAHRGEASVVVGIEDPARPYDNVPPLATIEISNEAVATSGGGRRWWTIDGVRHSKVLDPRTGSPAEHIRSATVVAPTAEAADVLATTCLVLDPDQAMTLVHNEGGECYLVHTNGNIISSSPRFLPA